MKCFCMDLNKALKIVLLGKEALIPPRMHYSRYLTENVLYFITKGSLKLRVNGEEITLKAGDICLFGEGERQEPAESSFCEYYYVHFKSDDIHEAELSEGEYLRRLQKKRDELYLTDTFSARCYDFCNVIVKSENHIQKGELFDAIENILQRSVLTTESRLPENRLAVSNAIASVMIKLENNSIKESRRTAPKTGKSYEIAQRIASYIELHYREPITGEHIEQEFYLTFDYANRIFHKIMGCTIIKYWNIVRIQHAKARIRATNMPIKEVAMETGFENVHYFSRLFKKTEGLSPSEYKRKFFDE